MDNWELRRNIDKCNIICPIPVYNQLHFKFFKLKQKFVFIQKDGCAEASSDDILQSLWDCNRTIHNSRVTAIIINASSKHDYHVFLLVACLTYWGQNKNNWKIHSNSVRNGHRLVLLAIRLLQTGVPRISTSGLFKILRESTNNSKLLSDSVRNGHCLVLPAPCLNEGSLGLRSL